MQSYQGKAVNYAFWVFLLTLKESSYKLPYRCGFSTIRSLAPVDSVETQLYTHFDWDFSIKNKPWGNLCKNLLNDK